MVPLKLLDKLDRKFGKFAISNLMMYVVFANAVVFVMNLMSNGSFSVQLMLIPQLVFQGEIWRVFTFLMIPPTNSIIFIIFALYFYYMIGQTLEHEWGSFKFNVYYFIGVLVMIASSLIFGVISDVSFLNLTLFLAFATLYPNYEIRIYFILPVKVKYLAYISAGLYVFLFFTNGFATKVSILAGLSNYLLFFGKDLVSGRKRQIVNSSRKAHYNKSLKGDKPYKNKCSVCGRTDVDFPDLEFRYCSKCEGHFEYCLEHLASHEHVIKDTLSSDQEKQ